MSPRFSIITVILNPPIEDFRRTIDSVIGQHERDWELIIKDGGSEASCLAAIPGDPRIRVVSAKDKGIFDAMNQALDLATGELICFLNAGDWFYDGSALSHVATAVKSAPGADFIYGDVAKPSSRSGFERYADVLTRSYLFNRMICHQAWFVSRSYYGRPERYETDLSTGADRRFLIRMILKNQVAYQHVGKVIVSYKGGGVSQDPANVRAAAIWQDQLIRQVYPSAEYQLLSAGKRLRSVIKRLCYDSGLWRIRRVWLRMKVNRQSAA